MSRCQHCNKLTHSEDLYVYYYKEDFEKVHELIGLSGWVHKIMYHIEELKQASPNEYGKLKCGDIYIHFIQAKIISQN